MKKNYTDEEKQKAKIAGQEHFEKCLEAYVELIDKVDDQCAFEIVTEYATQLIASVMIMVDSDKRDQYVDLVAHTIRDKFNSTQSLGSQKIN